MSKIVNLFRQLLTGPDNTTHDIGRWSWLASWMAVLGHSVYSAYMGHYPSLTELAGALSLTAGAHGIAIGAKGNTEPGGRP